MVDRDWWLRCYEKRKVVLSVYLKVKVWLFDGSSIVDGILLAICLSIC